MPGDFIFLLDGPEVELVDVEFLKLGFANIIVDAGDYLLLEDTHAILVDLRPKSQVLLLLDLLALLIDPIRVVFLERLLRQAEEGPIQRVSRDRLPREERGRQADGRRGDDAPSPS